MVFDFTAATGAVGGRVALSLAPNSHQLGLAVSHAVIASLGSGLAK